MNELPKTHRVLYGIHPCWQGVIYLGADGTLSRPDIDQGRYELKENKLLTLYWDRWLPEVLSWNPHEQVYHNESREFTLRPLDPTTLPDYGVVFDIGSHDGRDALTLLLAGYTVISVDASAKMVQATRALNKSFADKHTVIHAALGQNNGEGIFYENTEATDWSSLSKSIAHRNPSHHITQQKITVITLDQLIEQFGLPSYIKIDIEGGELDALAGLTQKAPLISIEFDHLGVSEPELLKEMQTRGYTHYAWVPQDSNVTKGWNMLGELDWSTIDTVTTVPFHWCDIYFR